MNKISIIIPVYNSEKYLIECFDSILNQSINQNMLEVIIIDDFSSDNSQDICQKYVKNNDGWSYYRNLQNQGPAKSRNFGIKHSTGDYIAFLDSDDILYEKNLEILYKNIVATNSDMVIAKINSFDEHGEYGYYSDKFIRKNKITTIYKNKKLVNCISICSKLYQRKLIENISFLENTLHEDNSFTILSLLNCKRISLVNQYLYYRRFRSVKKDSIMQNLNYKTYTDLLRNYRYVILNSKKNRKSIFFLHYYMLRKSCNYIIKHVNKKEKSIAKLDLTDFIDFLYQEKTIKKFRKTFYLIFCMVYYNIAKIFKEVKI